MLLDAVDDRVKLAVCQVHQVEVMAAEFGVGCEFAGQIDSSGAVDDERAVIDFPVALLGAALAVIIADRVHSDRVFVIVNYLCRDFIHLLPTFVY